MKRCRLRLAAALLALSAVSSLVSCGGAAPAADGTTALSDTGTTAPAEPGYDFGGKDFGGYEFKVLNFESIWNCFVYLDFEEQTGESLNDAVYNRNRLIEEKLNFKLNEIKEPYVSIPSSQTAICDKVIQSVMAGDFAYDAAYLPVGYKTAVVTDGYLMNLLDIPELQLNEEWWDREINKTLTVDDTLYVASSPLQFMSLDMSWALLFNQDMMDDAKVEYPYQLVRDGKWTLDKFNEYAEKFASLNGDDSFTYSDDGKAVYGIAGHGTSITAFNFAAGNRLTTNEGKQFKLGIETERNFTTLERLGKILSTSNGNVWFETAETKPGFYLRSFKENRAAFCTIELKAALEERDMEATFGLLPMPKYDESQDKYYSYVGMKTCLLCIPKTQPDPSRAGTILDALTYESYKNVLPVYYDITVSQKGLRNDESIEMLDIIHKGRATEFADIFGVTTTYTDKIMNTIKAEETSFSSIAASYKSAIEENLAQILKVFQ